MGLEKRLHFWFIVEWRVIHDDQTVWPKLRYQHFAHPCSNSVVRTAALKQHGRDPLVSTLRHDEVGALAIIATDFSEDFFAARCPSVRAIAMRSKSAFIKVHDVFTAVG